MQNPATAVTERISNRSKGGRMRVEEKKQNTRKITDAIVVGVAVSR